MDYREYVVKAVKGQISEKWLPETGEDYVKVEMRIPHEWFEDKEFEKIDLAILRLIEIEKMLQK